MLAKLRDKYAEHLSQLDLRLESYLDAEFDYGYDIALSAMTLHHYNHQAKTAIYKRIFNALRAGSMYIECDYMLSENPAVSSILRLFSTVHGVSK
ncbi:hypothetical protein FACS1894105_10510 [Clostridia bacterium]|nr:hypothetical protein FACS1894105_10510 [Clostridia bacterium]